jgi:hypothetical protein
VGRCVDSKLSLCLVGNYIVSAVVIVF